MNEQFKRTKNLKNEIAKLLQKMDFTDYVLDLCFSLAIHLPSYSQTESHY